MNYTPVRISTLKPQKELPFPVYIFFKERHLLYIRAGDLIESPKFKQLRKQKITKFFISSADELKYQAFLEEMLNDTLSDTSISVDAKLDIVEGSSHTALDKLAGDPGSQVAFQMTQSAAKGVSKVVLENPDALRTLFEKQGEEGELIVKHSMNVCALSVKLAEAKKCTPKEIENLAIAALMHDVGLSEKEKKLFSKAKSDFSSEDKLLYFKHTKEGLNILKERKWINSEIINLIENHEENLNGTGPFKKGKLSKLEEILSLVNAYDKKIMCEGKTPTEAIKEFKIEEIGNYGLQTIQELEKVIKGQFSN